MSIILLVILLLTTDGESHKDKHKQPRFSGFSVLPLTLPLPLPLSRSLLDFLPSLLGVRQMGTHTMFQEQEEEISSV